MTERRGVDGRTRDRVRSLLLELGPCTAAVLSDRLALSAAAVRRHLDALVAEGTVHPVEPRGRTAGRGRGRPARLYALTEAGHAAGPSAYDELAAGALRFLAQAAGEHAVEAFARARAADVETRYARELAGVAPAARPGVLARALSDDGYAATTSSHGAGTQLCQHHCPVQHVAEQFPQLCDAETAALGRLLDVHVQRLATIAHGDGVCTLHIPAIPPEGTIPAIPPGGTTPTTQHDDVRTGS
jgi:predicted ArsR family transcriptional regulator